MLSALGLLWGSQSQPWGYCETLCRGIKMSKMKKLRNCFVFVCGQCCVSVWRSEVYVGASSCRFLPYFLRQPSVFLTEPRVPLIGLDCPESWRDPPAPPTPTPHTSIDLRVCASTARFYVGAGGPNSGSRACSASAKSTEPSCSESGSVGPVSSQ